jgi:branched-chain amino acid transport system permease protein
VLLAGAIVLAAVPLASGHGATLDVGITSLYFALLVLSWNLVAGYIGIFSFGHVAFALVGAYVSAILSQRAPGVPVPVAMLAGGVAAGLLGAVLGAISLRLRDSALVVMTFAFAELARIVVLGLSDVTGGSNGTQSAFLFEAGRGAMPYYLCALGLVGVFVVLQLTIMRTRVGYYLAAIRDDEVGLRAIGLNPLRWKVLTFTYSAVWAGLAGAFLASYIGFITPEIGSFNNMSWIIAMGVIGGLGTVSGPLAGAVALTLLTDRLAVTAELSSLLFAIAVLVVLLVAPEGLAGIGRSRWPSMVAGVRRLAVGRRGAA